MRKVILAALLAVICTAHPTSQVPSTAAETRIVFLRPPSFGLLLGVQTRQAIASMIAIKRAVNELSDDVTAARAAYWKAHPNGPGLEQARAELARALFQKDLYYLNRAAVTPEPFQQRDAALETFVRSFGEVDGGIDPLARESYNRWAGSVVTALRNADAARLADSLSAKNGDYERYRVLRDTLEFYDGPASPLRSSDAAVYLCGVIAEISSFTLTPEQVLAQYDELRTALGDDVVRRTTERSRQSGRSDEFSRANDPMRVRRAARFDEALETPTTEMAVIKLLHPPAGDRDGKASEWVASYAAARREYETLIKNRGASFVEQAYEMIRKAPQEQRSATWGGVAKTWLELTPPRLGCYQPTPAGCFRELATRTNLSTAPASGSSVAELQALLPDSQPSIDAMYREMVDLQMAKIRAAWAGKRNLLFPDMGNTQPQPAIVAATANYRTACLDHTKPDGTGVDACQVAVMIDRVFGPLRDIEYVRAAGGGVPVTTIPESLFRLVVKTVDPISITDIVPQRKIGSLPYGLPKRARLAEPFDVFGTDLPAGMDVVIFPVLLEDVRTRAGLPAGTDLWIVFDSIVARQDLGSGPKTVLIPSSSHQNVAAKIVLPDGREASWLKTSEIPAGSMLTFPMSPPASSRVTEILSSLGPEMARKALTFGPYDLDAGFDAPVTALTDQKSLARFGDLNLRDGTSMGRPFKTTTEELVVPPTARSKKSEKQVVTFSYWGRVGVGVAKREPDTIIWVRVSPR